MKMGLGETNCEDGGGGCNWLKIVSIASVMKLWTF